MARRRPDDDLLPLLLAMRRRRLARGPGRNRALRVVLVAVLVVLLAAIGAAVVAAATAVQVALTDCTLAGRTPRAEPTTSVIYAANGAYLGAIPSPTYRQPVRYAQISPWVRRATVAAEDRTFWR